MLSAALPAQLTEPGTTVLASATGFQAGDLFGWLVRSLGDVDRDGIADFAVAAPFYNLNQGRVSVHSGRDGKLLWFRDSGVTSSILGFDLATVRDLDRDGARETRRGPHVRRYRDRLFGALGERAPFRRWLAFRAVAAGITKSMSRTIHPEAAGYGDVDLSWMIGCTITDVIFARPHRLQR